MEEVKVLELYQLHYSDLLLLSSTPSSCGEDQVSRLEKIRTAIMETLGPKGPGLLSITAVPNASLLRRNLLRLAPKLALLHPDNRKRLLKEHNLGTDVSLKNPCRKVSSFAMQLKYAEALESVLGKPSHVIHPHSNSEPTYLDVDEVRNFQDDEFENLSNVFKDLGYCMMDLGLRLAQICDKFIGGRELERSLLESGTAKGRLIHYHSVLDNLLLRETGRSKGSSKNQANSKKDCEHSLNTKQDHLQGPNSVITGNKIDSYKNQADLWQEWHYDYGIFTVLTAPMFFVQSNSSENMATDQSSVSCSQESPYPNGYSYLQIFDPNKNTVLMVKTSPESFIIQVGESADILSKGKLRSTLHCVSKPVKVENISRETFVVFLQPAWSKKFSTSDYTMEDSHNSNESAPDFHKIIPPLSSRLKDGMTFAEFSRETTKQYYGGSGLQSKR
ncbi:uncharacterized protein LOC8275408 [Ricinus communis]|uniref:Isopenicillin N synthase-like Fe(2+) 2OG dioxygenase domain-containing protein n=1 Tax=Ricinus communis TaxID=3988 RepID=B9SFG1_RICCO|nr:uncharacterized protein LOC8275408 [Ricinus communis]EEF37573.1 hypothetical protein RCOM_0646070 [Ricinus communis]|eukprot:XP_002524730.1 uncharacterized protein LOC8275408 [Ricinus communis]